MHKIAHLTSVHPRHDARIYLKECRSLAKQNWSVSLVVADGKGDEITDDNIHIFDVGRSAGRLNRFIKTTRRVLQKAIELDVDIYHLHDPELIPIGLKLLRLNKRVIFDAHEDLPKQLLSKPYLKPWQAKILSMVCTRYEYQVLKKFTGIVAATPSIHNKFLQINLNTVNINNYPLLEEFSILGSKKHKSEINICYIGGLSKVRGIKEIVEAMTYVPNSVHLQIAGQFSESDFEHQIRALPSWRKVDYLGFLNRKNVQDVLANAIAGLVTLHPIISYQDALPVKMFEYMAAGLPVIASNIPLWEGIIQNSQCGLCVDPYDPKEIAKAIEWITDNPEEASEMGRNGQEAVYQHFNWTIEEKKLYVFYQNLMESQ